MKYLLILLCVCCVISCKDQGLSQNPRINPLYNSSVEIQAGDYLKDTNNDFNPYIGTWEWQNGTNSLTIELQKLEMFYDDSIDNLPLYGDFLVGEYKYIVNGVELYNSLPVNMALEPFDNNIVAYTIFKRESMASFCPECPPDSSYLEGSFSQDDREPLTGRITLIHFFDQGVEKIRIHVGLKAIVGVSQDYGGPTTFSLPNGEYTLVR